MDYKTLLAELLLRDSRRVAHLHQGHIGVSRSLSVVLPGDTGLRLAKFIVSGVEGGIRHDGVECRVHKWL